MYSKDNNRSMYTSCNNNYQLQFLLICTAHRSLQTRPNFCSVIGKVRGRKIYVCCMRFVSIWFDAAAENTIQLSHAQRKIIVRSHDIYFLYVLSTFDKKKIVSLIKILESSNYFFFDDAQYKLNWNFLVVWVSASFHPNVHAFES